MGKIKPLTLEIDERLWKNFKHMIPRSVKLNDKIVQLIKKECEKDSEFGDNPFLEGGLKASSIHATEFAPPSSRNIKGR